MKRAHLRTLAISGRCARAFGLTPARYDLLYAIWRGGARLQSDLWSMLDVSRATVSRMLISLEELQLVRRGPQGGRASRRVELTTGGRHAIEDAFRGCHRPMLLLFESLYPRVPTRLERACEVSDLRDQIAFLKTRFGDRSRLIYPYNSPEDVYPFVPDPYDQPWPAAAAACGEARATA